MYLVGIDIGKLKHSFCVMEKGTYDILVEPVFFNNNNDGFDLLYLLSRVFQKKMFLLVWKILVITI